MQGEGRAISGRGPASPVIVTGAAGRLGRAVIDELRSHGWSIIGLDSSPGRGVRQADLLHQSMGSEALADCHAVIHLAALPDPFRGSSEYTITTNMGLTTRVLMDAMEAGVPRFLFASSQCALGLPFAAQVIEPDYLPVDEAHPCRPEDAYGISKLVGEELCAYAARAFDADIACFRFPVIWNPDNHSEHVRSRIGNPVQSAKSLWAYIDLRDAVRAIRLWLENPSKNGFDIFNVAAPWPFLDGPLGPDEAAFTSRKIYETLNFRAQYRWYADRIESVA